MRDYAGKTAVITGAASGIGLALAERFASESMNVVLADIEAAPLRAVSAKIEARGAGVLALETDVSDKASMDRLGEAARETFGEVDFLCLNAGVNAGGAMASLTMTDWEWTLGVNLWGVIHGIRVFLPQLNARNQGRIVVTASVSGLTSYPNHGPYNASKHAVITICETLYAELAEAGSQVRIHCLCPGSVATNIGTAARNRPTALENEGTSIAPAKEKPALVEGFPKPPAEIAELVVDAIARDRFWIETDELYRDIIRARHRSIENRTDPPARGFVYDPYLAHTED